MSTLVELVPIWRSDLVGSQGLGERTALEYSRHVEGLVPFLAASLGIPEEEVGVEVSRRDLTQAIAIWRFAPDSRYNDDTSAPREKSPLTVARRISALRSFFDWCVEEGEVVSSPATRLKAPSSQSQTPPALSSDSVKDVLVGAQLSRQPERDTLLVGLLVTCGLSLEEVASLKVPAVSSPIQVTSRGRTRWVALSPMALRALEAYLPVRGKLLTLHGLTSERLLLAGRPRTDKTTKALTLDPRKASLSEALERALVRAGVEQKGVASHALRVAFARAALQTGSHTVAALQEQLGHSSLVSLRSWAGASSEELGAAAARHPFADL